MTSDEVKIRDLSRVSATEWTPPVGAMGGPPAHELYRDLVAHGGLRLLKGADGAPWVEMQDGERRRAFRVPGVLLRGALDRFRMRRNLRPVPESDLDEFARVVQARISDPDARIPRFAGTLAESAPPAVVSNLAPEPPPAPMSISAARSPVLTNPLERELDDVLAEVDRVAGRHPAALRPPNPPAVWREDTAESAGPLPPTPGVPLDVSISGARRIPSGPENGLPRYLRVLRGLVQNGGWLGTLGDLTRLTGDPADTVYASLLKYRGEFTDQNLVVAAVEVQDGWRWLVVDRTRLDSTAVSDEPPIP